MGLVLFIAGARTSQQHRLPFIFKLALNTSTELQQALIKLLMATKTKILLWLIVVMIGAPSQAATLYLSSVDGSDADNGTTWALAKATLAGAFTAAAAGDIIYVDPAHAETQASAMTLTSPGTDVAPVEVYCAANRSAEPPTSLVTTATASVTVTGSFAISFDGFAYLAGIIINDGTGSSATPTFSWITTNPWGWIFENCALRLLSTGAGAFTFGASSSTVDNNSIILINTPLQFGATTQSIKPRCRVRWLKTPSAVGGTIPAALFINPGGSGADVQLRGVDLSSVGSGKNLINVTTPQSTKYYFERCTLGASVGIITGTPTRGGTEVTMWDCDSADTNYKYLKQNFYGTIADSVATYRNSGASDGQVSVGRVMTSTANTKLYSPLESDPIVVFNTSTNSQTLTVHVATDNVTLNNSDAWIQVEEPGTSGLPLSVFVSSKVANRVTATSNYSTDAVSTWTGVPGTPVKQNISVTYTPNKRGAILVRVMLARASTVMYVDPTANIQ